MVCPFTGKNILFTVEVYTVQRLTNPGSQFHQIKAQHFGITIFRSLMVVSGHE